MPGGRGGLIRPHLPHPRLLQLLQSDVLLRGRRQVVFFFLHPRIGVDLVEHQHLRLLRTTQFHQCLLHHTDLFLEVGMGDIHHMHQQIGLTHLVEGTLKTLHEVRGQLTDKTHGVSQEEGKIVDGHLTDGGVERGEELVLSKHIALGQQVHHRTLAHIGITHESHTDQTSTVLPLGSLLLVYLCQTLL